jgi:pimeloyl-ACP methyl ester carboxylesterase
LVLVAPFGPKYLADETTTYSLTAEQIAGVTEAERTGPLQLRKASVAGMPKEPYAPEVLEWLYGLTLKAPSWSAGRALTAIMYEDFRGDLGNIKVPTLILHGKADQNAPALGSEEYQRGIEQAKIYWFEESGHSPSIEEADHFNSVVSEFLQRRGHADAPDTAKVEQASR